MVSQSVSLVLLLALRWSAVVKQSVSKFMACVLQGHQETNLHGMQNSMAAHHLASACFPHGLGYCCPCHSPSFQDHGSPSFLLQALHRSEPLLPSLGCLTNQVRAFVGQLSVYSVLPPVSSSTIQSAKDSVNHEITKHLICVRQTLQIPFQRGKKSV